MLHLEMFGMFGVQISPFGHIYTPASSMDSENLFYPTAIITHS